MERRHFLKTAALAAPALAASRCLGEDSSSTGADKPVRAQRKSGEAPRKHLFLDDHHVELTENLSRVMHQPEKHDRPILEATQPVEYSSLNLFNPPWWDETDGLWKMIYIGGRPYDRSLPGLYSFYAFSEDGFNWEKPSLDLRSVDENPEVNNIINLGFKARGKANRILFVRVPGKEPPFRAVTHVGGFMRPLVSTDGLSWELQDVKGPASHDEHRMCYDSLQDRYPRRFSFVERERWGDHIAATPDTSVPVSTDGLDLEMLWKDGPDLSTLKGREVRIYFLLRNAHLYSFWFDENQ